MCNKKRVRLQSVKKHFVSVRPINCLADIGAEKTDPSLPGKLDLSQTTQEHVHIQRHRYDEAHFWLQMLASVARYDPV